MKADTEIESLARMTAEGFLSIQKTLVEFREEMHQSFNRLDSREDSVELKLESKIDQLNDRMDRVVILELDHHVTRIKDLEIARSKGFRMNAA